MQRSQIIGGRGSIPSLPAVHFLSTLTSELGHQRQGREPERGGQGIASGERRAPCLPYDKFWESIEEVEQEEDEERWQAFTSVPSLVCRCLTSHQTLCS